MRTNIYDGQWLGGRYHGHGKLILKDGGEYVGAFSNGKYHGHGKMTYANGDVFEGMWENGRRCEGVYTPADAVELTAGKAALKKDDHCDAVSAQQLIDARTVLVQVLKNTEIEKLNKAVESEHVKGYSKGKVTLSDGTVYEGEYRNGKRHGQGKMTFPSGNTYEGEWKDGKYYGQGIFTFKGEGKYVGEWKDSKRHGQGTFTFKDGGKYIGEWRNSKRHGKGRFIYANGDVLEGEWRDGERCDESEYTFIRADERVEEYSKELNLRKRATIFVSSTFVDMQVERDSLRDLVLPKYLSDFIEEYDAEIDLIDLRWGVDTSAVSEEEQGKKVLQTCIDEIERSRPFFIGILGDRYGWIPSREDIEIALVGNEGLCSDSMSVTELEIKHGVLDSKVTPRCLFYHRSIENEDALLDVQREILLDSEQGRKRLDMLKQRILNEHGNSVRDYSVYIDPDNDYDVSNFCELIAEDLMELLREEWGPPSKVKQHPMSIEVALQREFLYSRADNFAGRKELIVDLLALCSNDVKHAPSALISISEPEVKKGANIFLIKGEGGSGKSAVMSKLASLAANQHTVLPFFCGLSAESSDVAGMLKYFIYYLADTKEQVSNSLLESYDVTLLRTQFYRLLKEKCEKGSVVLLIDALDQLYGEDARLMQWLTDDLPDNCRVVCSIISGQEEDVIARLGGAIYEIPPLTSNDVADIAKSVSRKHRKEIQDEVVDAIISRKGAPDGSAAIYPLYISLLIQRFNLLDRHDHSRIKEMVHDEFTHMDALSSFMIEKVNSLPANSMGVYLSIIEKASSLIGEEFVEAALCMIASSRFGLREEDLKGSFDKLGISYSPADFSWLRQMFGGHISQGTDLAWDFSHRNLRRALHENFSDKIAFVNRQGIALYFLDRVTDYERDVFVDREILYHLWKADLPKAAAEVLVYCAAVTGHQMSPPITTILTTMSEIYQEESVKKSKNRFIAQIATSAKYMSLVNKQLLLLALDRHVFMNYIPQATVEDKQAVYQALYEAVKGEKTSQLKHYMISVIYCMFGDIASTKKKKGKWYSRSWKAWKEVDIDSLVSEVGSVTDMFARLSQVLGEYYMSIGSTAAAEKFFIDYLDNRGGFFEKHPNTESFSDYACGFPRIIELMLNEQRLEAAKKYLDQYEELCAHDIAKEENYRVLVNVEGFYDMLWRYEAKVNNLNGFFHAVMNELELILKSHRLWPKHRPLEQVFPVVSGRLFLLMQNGFDFVQLKPFASQYYNMAKEYYSKTEDNNALHWVEEFSALLNQ